MSAFGLQELIVMFFMFLGALLKSFSFLFFGF